MPTRILDSTWPTSAAAAPASLRADGSNGSHALRSPGACWLVGAGPGDPELLTLKAVRAIGQATVLLVDDLVGEQVLAFAAPTARIIHVGKRGGGRSTPQAEIERLMIEQALAGETVVRLKGGDPAIFGRCGEELQRLHEAGVAAQVVNGVSSGVAAATALAAPLTHRDFAHGVLLVTGHLAPGQPAMDWPALAATAHACRLTLVIYMGVRGAQAIQAGLLQGLPAHTPVAVVQSASLPDEKRLLTELGAMVADMQAQRIASPAIIIVGDVLKARQWLEQAPQAAALAAAPC